jgi:hypothetical protein
MEAILELYAPPYDQPRPLVCLDEKSVELHADVRPPLAVAPGKPKRGDYEDKRHGTRNVFLFLEPKAGQRHPLVTRRRTKHHWAYAMRYLVDVLYPNAVRIDIGLDNLNTHLADVLIEIFGKAEADRILKRLTFHYTPLPSAWLNMAEIEFSVMERQCLPRRLPDELTLATELIAWERPRNDAQVTIRWKFNTQDARRVFAQYYPANSDC